MGRNRGSIGLLAVFFLAAVAHARDRELKHDDGRGDDRRSSAGTGHVVAFERPEEGFAVTAVRIHGERYGGRYDPRFTVARVSICDSSLKVLAQAFAPYTLWDPGRADWAEVPVGPCRVPERFHVVVEFFPTATCGVYLSIDTRDRGEEPACSYSGAPGRIGKPLEDGEWMIRVVGTDRPPPCETADPDSTTVLAGGEGEPIGKRSSAGTGHAVLFEAPAKQRLLCGVSLHGQRYGHGYDPETTFAHVFVCDSRLNVLYRTAFPYAAFPSDAPDWVDLDLGVVPVPRRFAVLVCFDPTASKGVYVSQWAEKGTTSMQALPGEVQGKCAKGEGWMIRARVAASAGKSELPIREEREGGVDAARMAEVLAELDRLETAEDCDAANALVEKIASEAPDEVARLGRFHESEHFLLRESGMEARQVEALLAVMEAAHDAVTSRFGFERVSAVPDRRVHLSVTIDSGLETALFTDPGSAEYSRVVLRGPPRALRAPTQGGPHVVYGFCHELGHVLIGWKDGRHRWAHYIGSIVTSDVHKKLGDAGWWDPYDYDAIEGLPRFEKEIEGAKPGLADDASVGRLFRAIGERFGEDVYGKAVPWVRAHREGEPFHAVRLYLLDDLRQALKEVTQEPGAVDELFGG